MKPTVFEARISNLAGVITATGITLPVDLPTRAAVRIDEITFMHLYTTPAPTGSYISHMLALNDDAAAADDVILQENGLIGYTENGLFDTSGAANMPGTIVLNPFPPLYVVKQTVYWVYTSSVITQACIRLRYEIEKLKADDYTVLAAQQGY